MINTLICDFSGVLVVRKNQTWRLNEELLSYINSLEYVRKVVYTNASMQYHQAIKPNLEDVFSNIITSYDLGLSKTNTEDYLKLLNHVNEGEKSVLFIDDNPSNIEAANLAGINTILHTSNATTINSIFKLLSTQNDQ